MDKLIVQNLWSEEAIFATSKVVGWFITCTAHPHFFAETTLFQVQGNAFLKKRRQTYAQMTRPANHRSFTGHTMLITISYSISPVCLVKSPVLRIWHIPPNKCATTPVMDDGRYPLPCLPCTKMCIHHQPMLVPPSMNPQPLVIDQLTFWSFNIALEDNILLVGGLDHF